MKSYVLLSLLCYLLLLLFPLSALPAPTPPATDKPTTEPTAPETGATFTVLNANTNTLLTFSERDFLIYTLAAEMPATYHLEALKAQAVAAYTFYSYEKAHNTGNTNLQGADFSSLPASFPDTYSPEGLKKTWGDTYPQALTQVATAVDAVLGERLTYNGEVILASYHSSNWGRTETASAVWGTDVPYLQSVVSSGDPLAADNASTVSVTAEQLAAAFPTAALTGDPATWIPSPPTLTAAGSVASLTLGTTAFTGRQIREALGLRSACFTVAFANGTFTFSVKGYGHGVGLSQCGAQYMAQQGFTYDQILAHYYTGTTLKK